MKHETFIRAADTDTFTRAAEIRPNSYVRETRTFTATLATGRPIERRGGHEILDLSSLQLPQSAPLLLDHAATVANTVGRVSNIRIEGDAVVGDCKISGDPSLNSLCERISDGTLTDISIGYSVRDWREARSASGERIRTAVNARLHHASLVAEGADPRSGIRSLDEPDYVPPVGSSPSDGDRHALLRDQQTRQLGRALGLAPELVDRAIGERWSDERLMAHVRNRSGLADIRTTGGHVSLDDPQVHRSAVRDCIVARMAGTEAQGPARELQSLSWPELHRRHLRQAGQSISGLSDVEVVTRALSTSDLPIVAGQAVNLRIRQTYDAAVSPIAALFGARDLPDFRAQTEAIVDWTTLSVGKVGELGEFKSSYVTESGESYSLFTLGGITGISRQLWINGAGALRNLADGLGRRLAADVSDRMTAYLVQGTLAGPNMADGSPVFSTSTDGEGTRSDVASLDTTSVDTVVAGVLAARASAARRKGAGNVMIGVTPSIWLTPPEFEPNAIRALATVSATEVADVNPLAGRLQIVSEPRLTSTTTSYLVAPPSQMDGAVRVSLAGAPGPQTESRWGFEVDAVQFKIRLDTGFGWVEWRSWTRLDHTGA